MKTVTISEIIVAISYEKNCIDNLATSCGNPMFDLNGGSPVPDYEHWSDELAKETPETSRLIVDYTKQTGISVSDLTKLIHHEDYTNNYAYVRIKCALGEFYKLDKLAWDVIHHVYNEIDGEEEFSIYVGTGPHEAFEVRYVSGYGSYISYEDMKKYIDPYRDDVQAMLNRQAKRDVDFSFLLLGGVMKAPKPADIHSLVVFIQQEISYASEIRQGSGPVEDEDYYHLTLLEKTKATSNKVIRFYARWRHLSSTEIVRELLELDPSLEIDLLSRIEEALYPNPVKGSRPVKTMLKVSRNLLFNFYEVLSSEVVDLGDGQIEIHQVLISRHEGVNVPMLPVIQDSTGTYVDPDYGSLYQDLLAYFEPEGLDPLEASEDIPF